MNKKSEKAKLRRRKDLLAAKISLKSLEIDEDEDESRRYIRNPVREVNIMSKLNHPSIVKFIGFSMTNFRGDQKPVIMTEYMTGGSLNDIIKAERSGNSKAKWNETQKHIALHGFASAMSYRNIINRDLKQDNILMDGKLYPKIADFGFSKILHRNEDSLSAASTGGFKGTMMNDFDFSTAGDVYSFGIIAYEVITNEELFKNCSFVKLIGKVSNGERSPFEYKILNAYKDLIEKCWDQEKSDRLTFEQIVDEMKSGNGFITDLVNDADFYNYVDYIDDCIISFESGKPIISMIHS